MQAQAGELASDFGDQRREGRVFAKAIAAEVVGCRGDLLVCAGMRAKPQDRGMDGFDVLDAAGPDEDVC